MNPINLLPAIQAIDASNSEDPTLDTDEQGTPHPKELLYGFRMSKMLLRYKPDAADAIQIAARAQHIERWRTPRNSFSMDKSGYHQWRTSLYRFHSERTNQILTDLNYPADFISRATLAIDKRNLKNNPDSQLIEDIATLVFLESYLASFVKTKPEYNTEKWVTILRKTWKKMSPQAQEFCLTGGISLPSELKSFVVSAVTGVE